ncbi:MAG TPA: nucleoside triphosphate pyrophosphatase [Sphingomonadaceae bacterium]|nr:nucleoside triphosphate pyrophosphatase [Sphingomonadaceae bacterium]
MSAPRPSPTLILASASPRRRELLARLGIVPAAIRASDIDETPHRAELPRAYALRMAREKALASRQLQGEDEQGEDEQGEDEQASFILSGDTVVACGRRILPKAEDEATARQCLHLLSGRRHRVLSAVALLAPDGTLQDRLSETIVRFKSLSAEEIDAYVASGEWHGKAGGYAIQGAAEGLIAWISGSHSGVMGLPLFESRAILKSAGFPIG